MASGSLSPTEMAAETGVALVERESFVVAGFARRRWRRERFLIG